MILNTFFVLNPMENLYKNKEELKKFEGRAASLVSPFKWKRLDRAFGGLASNKAGGNMPRIKD